MNCKGRISGLVLATVFGLGMASSGLASAQNGGVLPPLPVSGESIAKEDNAVSSEIVGESFASAEKTAGKDDSVVSEQDSISTASGENPDETQKDDFIANGEIDGNSVLIENLSEEKSEVRDEPLEPAEEANGEDGPVISEQEDLLATSGENPDETQKDDFTANSKTNSTSATTENLGKEKGSDAVVNVEPAKKKLDINNVKAELLKGVGGLSLFGLGGGVGATAVKLGSSKSSESEELKKQNEELGKQKAKLELANKGMNAEIEELKKASSTSNEGKGRLPLWAIYLILAGIMLAEKEIACLVPAAKKSGKLNAVDATIITIINVADSALLGIPGTCAVFFGSGGGAAT